MPRLTRLAATIPHPRDVWDYYQKSLEAIAALHRSLKPPSVVAVGSPFFAMTADEVEVAIRTLTRELEQEVVLMTTACFEAIVQTDFRKRRERKGKDAVSRCMRRLVKQRDYPKWVPVEHLLRIWKDNHGRSQIIGIFNQLLEYRNWLAHGRYWVQQSGLANVDPVEALNRGMALVNALPGLDPTTI
jgi:hypothetical protein